MEIPRVHWIQWTKLNSNGRFQVHWIHWIHWTLSFGYLNGLVSTWCPYACHYVIQIYIDWPTEKANVRWTFHLSIGSNGHFRLAISVAQYLHEVHGLAITSFKNMVIDQLKKQMSDGNSTCPLDPMDKQNSNGHFQVHWIQLTLSFGYGRVSTWGPRACHYVIQIHGNWPTEKANVRWKLNLSNGSNGQTKFQWAFPGPLDPLDPMDTFVWLSQWKCIYMRSTGLSLRHLNTW
jgi:hypothetical protein